MGIKWPQWHTLIFEGQGKVQDVKKMLWKRRRLLTGESGQPNTSVRTSKKGSYLALSKQCCERNEERWTDKHRNVLKKIVVEGGWVQKRVYDVGWSNENKFQGCNKEEHTEKHRLYQCPCWKEVGSQIPKELRSKEQERQRKNGSGREESRRIFLNESQWLLLCGKAHRGRTERKLFMDRFHQSLPGEVHITSQRKRTLTIIGLFWQNNMFTGRSKAETL